VVELGSVPDPARLLISSASLAAQVGLGYLWPVLDATLKDAALLLVAHGTSEEPESGAVVYLHAAELRRRGIFAEVREAFWKQEPRVQNVLPELSPNTVFIAPFFASAGYFCERVIPEALGFSPGRPAHGPWVNEAAAGRRYFYCEPVGIQPSMVGAALGRAAQTLTEFPFPRLPQFNSVDLIIAAHGTERDPKSRDSAEILASQIRQLGMFADVHALYLEEEPKISRFAQVSKNSKIVVVPLFVSEGPHVTKDIPLQLGSPAPVLEQRLHNGQWPWRNPTEIRGKLLWYARPIGTHPQMADVILEAVRKTVKSVPA